MAKSDSKGLEAPLKKPAAKDFLKKKKTKTVEVPILLDPDLADELDEAKKEKGRLELLQRQKKVALPEDFDEQMKAAEERLDEANEAITENTVVFKFKGIGRRAMDELIDEHQPTNKQKALAREQGETDLQYNPETFPQALVAASCFEPDLTPEEAAEMWDSDDWNTSELVTLFMAAQEVNSYIKHLEVKKGSGQILG